MCPAPIPIVAAVVSGIVGGGVSAGIGIATSNSKHGGRLSKLVRVRDVLTAVRDLPPGVNQQDLDLCTRQINDQVAGSGVAVDVYNTTESSMYLSMHSLSQ